MKRRRRTRYRFFLRWLLVLVVAFVASASAGAADAKDEARLGTTLYQQDEDHLWNRVHAALLMRLGPDGKTYGEDRLEPLLWGESDHLLNGPAADRAVEVLEEFVRQRGESLIDDPLKRAVLQRDLWLIFNWLTSRTDHQPERQRLGDLLAKVIHRLSLSKEQIARLSDNYAAAVASQRFADRFDPDHPDQAYLPADLFKADGPWVSVGATSGPTAPRHLDERGSNRFTNSVFLIFLKLPAGRDATLDFLKQLAAFDQPLYVPNTDERSKLFLPNLPNPGFPQWPKGTEVALLRQAMLIDSGGRLVASPLTESLQLRVMRTEMPLMPQQTIEELYRISGGQRSGQAFTEFRLRRAALFAGEAGGLRDVSGEPDFKTGFNAHQWDEFTNRRSPASTSGAFPQRSQPFDNSRASCFGCHQYPGVYSFNSFHADFPFTVRRVLKDGRDGSYVPASHSLAPMPVEEVERAALEWKEEQPGWRALRRLLADAAR